MKQLCKVSNSVFRLGYILSKWKRTPADLERHLQFKPFIDNCIICLCMVMLYAMHTKRLITGLSIFSDTDLCSGSMSLIVIRASSSNCILNNYYKLYTFRNKL